jgi:hypothetical protein
MENKSILSFGLRRGYSRIITSRRPRCPSSVGTRAPFLVSLCVVRPPASLFSSLPRLPGRFQKSSAVIPFSPFRPSLFSSAPDAPPPPSSLPVTPPPLPSPKPISPQQNRTTTSSSSSPPVSFAVHTTLPLLLHGEQCLTLLLLPWRCRTAYEHPRPPQLCHRRRTPSTELDSATPTVAPPPR